MVKYLVPNRGTHGADRPPRGEPSDGVQSARVQGIGIATTVFEGSKLDPFKDYIRARLGRFDLPATTLLRDLKARAWALGGSRPSALAILVRTPSTPSRHWRILLR